MYINRIYANRNFCHPQYIYDKYNDKSEIGFYVLPVVWLWWHSPLPLHVHINISIYVCCVHISSRCCCSADGTSSVILYFMLHQTSWTASCSKTVNIFTKTEFSIGFILILSYFHAMCCIFLLYLYIFIGNAERRNY